MSISKLVARILATFDKADWRQDFRTIGRGVVIGGIVTPALSDEAGFIAGGIVVLVGLVLILVAASLEA